MDVVERVARAICASMNMAEDSWSVYRSEAIAAIKAMREPTVEMVKAGHPWAGIAGSSAKNTYTAMIDAALGEHK